MEGCSGGCEGVVVGSRRECAGVLGWLVDCYIYLIIFMRFMAVRFS